MIIEQDIKLFPFITGNWLMDVIFILYIVLIIAPIGMFLHEFGHAIGAKFVKADYIKIYFGMGKKKKTIQFQSIDIFISRLYFLGAYVMSERSPAYSNKEKIIISLLGPGFNILAAFIFYILTAQYSNPFISVIYIFNFWLGFINLIPFKIFGKQSDGYEILTQLISALKIK